MGLSLAAAFLCHPVRRRQRLVIGPSSRSVQPMSSLGRQGAGCIGEGRGTRVSGRYLPLRQACDGVQARRFGAVDWGTFCG